MIKVKICIQFNIIFLLDVEVFNEIELFSFAQRPIQ